MNKSINELREHPLSSLVPDMRQDEYEAFRDDVIERGVIEPLHILPDGTVLDGRHRLKVARELGLAELPVTQAQINGLSAAEYMIRAAILRRHLSDDQRAVLARKWQKVNVNPGGRGTPKSELSDTVSDSSKKDTRIEAAKMFAVPERKVRYAAAIEDKAPELITRVERGEMSLLDATRAVKEQRRERIRAENRKLVQQTAPINVHVKGNKYHAIVIDPPWDWGDEGDVDQFGRARPTYATMKFEEILALPVAALSEKNSHLYLWITNRSLPKGFALIEKWGFRYVACLTWCKPNIGMGNYFRGSTEHVLFGVRGSLELLRRDIGTWFSAERGKEFSEKPEAFYRLVEACSPGTWLEMFARKQRNGWVSWGAEL